MKIRYVLGASSMLIAFLTGCASTADGTGATASLAARSGSSVSGEVSFSETSNGLRLRAKIVGLTPGEHGFHIHEAGDCSAPDAMSAKGHFNPGVKAHGHQNAPEHHGGDMPNLIANALGEATYISELAGLGLSGPNGVLGRSVVVHADPDDYKSQPAGNSGKRVACGVIVAR
jgi:Cu-Zn family superoxide dismutase